MSRLIDRLKLVFLGLFALSAAAVLVYHMVWVWPSQRCEARGDWWDNDSRVCAKPIPLYVLTGRGRPGAPPAKPPAEPKTVPPKPAAAQSAR